MTNHITTFCRIGVTLGLAVLVSSVATSSGFAYSARAQQMCMGDAMRLCSSEIPNVSRIIACMRRNKANVSAGCRLVMEQEDPASKPKPVQAAEQKPPVMARAEQPVAPKPKPVQAAPVEQKPPVAARVEQPTPAAPQSAPAVEQKQAAIPVVTPPATLEAKPAPAGLFEQHTIAAPAIEQPRPRVNPFRHLAAQKPAALAILARTAVTGAKLAVTGEQKPAIVAPVAATATKPVQAAPVVVTPPVAAPVAPAAVKPVEVKPAPVARPIKVVRHRQKTRQVAVAAYTPRESGGGGYERYMSMAAPIMSLIMSYW